MLRAACFVLLFASWVVAQDPDIVWSENATEWGTMYGSTHSDPDHHGTMARYAYSSNVHTLTPGLDGTYELFWFTGQWPQYDMAVAVDGNALTWDSAAGWRSLGVFTLTPSSTITVQQGNVSGFGWFDAMGATSSDPVEEEEPPATSELEALNQLIEESERHSFLLHALAIEGSLLWGAALWRLLVLAKNQRSLW